MGKNNLAPIFIFAPTTSEKRMQYINSFARGFIYCVARKGVTGKETGFSDTLDQYLARCRKATDLPLAVGFGVKEKADIDYLRGKTDIAVIGSQTIRLVDEQGGSALSEGLSKICDNDIHMPAIGRALMTNSQLLMFAAAQLSFP